MTNDKPFKLSPMTEKMKLLVLNELIPLFDRKNKDYGNHFFEYTAEGAYQDLLRKWSRIETIFKNGTIACSEESLENTLLDLANYSLMTILLLRSQSKSQSSPVTKQQIIEFLEKCMTETQDEFELGILGTLITIAKS